MHLELGILVTFKVDYLLCYGHVALFPTIIFFNGAVYYGHRGQILVIIAAYMHKGLYWNTMKNVFKFNTLRPTQNGRRLGDDHFKRIFVNENVWIPIPISLKYTAHKKFMNTSAKSAVIIKFEGRYYGRIGSDNGIGPNRR